MSESVAESIRAQKFSPLFSPFGCYFVSPSFSCGWWMPFIYGIVCDRDPFNRLRVEKRSLMKWDANIFFSFFKLYSLSQRKLDDRVGISLSFPCQPLFSLSLDVHSSDIGSLSSFCLWSSLWIKRRPISLLRLRTIWMCCKFATYCFLISFFIYIKFLIWIGAAFF